MTLSPFLLPCLLATAALAPPVDTLRGLQRLDRQRCFGNVCLEENIRKSQEYEQLASPLGIPGLCYCVYLPPNTSRLYGCQVRLHHVMTRLDRRVFSITLYVADSATSQLLLQALQDRYGSPTRSAFANSQEYTWTATRTSVRYHVECKANNGFPYRAFLAVNRSRAH